MKVATLVGSDEAIPKILGELIKLPGLLAEGSIVDLPVAQRSGIVEPDVEHGYAMGQGSHADQVDSCFGQGSDRGFRDAA